MLKKLPIWVLAHWEQLVNGLEENGHEGSFVECHSQEQVGRNQSIPLQQ